MLEAGPSELAAAVQAALRRRRQRPPPLSVLQRIFQVMYHASIAPEEGQHVQFQVVYLNPNNPDPQPPKRIVRDRWNYIPLPNALEMTVEQVRKIGPASDPRSSSFVVYPDQHLNVVLWGLVDQQNRYQDFLNREKLTGPERPGLFEARIVGPAHIVVSIGYERVAELDINELRTGTLNVFSSGPVREALAPGIASLVEYIRSHVESNTFTRWHNEAGEFWVDTLCRLLLHVQGFRHGGAILLTPAASYEGLNVKYPLHYRRLRTALERFSVSYIQADAAWGKVADTREAGAQALEWPLYFEKGTWGIEQPGSESELESSIWFVSLLSRVDGLVLCNPHMEVAGFGVEIVSDHTPTAIYQALTAPAHHKHRRAQDLARFGTRHRSMMRYCDSVSGSVGFVVSQDGDVRIMTRVGNALVFWENIRLQTEFRSVQVGQKSSRKPTAG